MPMSDSTTDPSHLQQSTECKPVSATSLHQLGYLHVDLSTQGIRRTTKKKGKKTSNDVCTCAKSAFVPHPTPCNAGTIHPSLSCCSLPISAIRASQHPKQLTETRQGFESAGKPSDAGRAKAAQPYNLGTQRDKPFVCMGTSNVSHHPIRCHAYCVALCM